MSKSPGPDEWHPRFLKESAAQLVVPLQVLFRKFLDYGFIPDQWKTANVIPIFKKGNRKSPSNYRPISLTSVTCKVFESLIRDAIMDYLLANRLLSKEQHGFMPCREILCYTVAHCNGRLDYCTPRWDSYWIGLSLLCSKICSLCFLAFPQFSAYYARFLCFLDMHYADILYL